MKSISVHPAEAAQATEPYPTFTPQEVAFWTRTEKYRSGMMAIPPKTQ